MWGIQMWHIHYTSMRFTMFGIHSIITSQHSLVEQVGFLSSMRVKDLNAKFRPRALLEQLHAQLLRGGQEEGGGVGHHVLALFSHLQRCFRLCRGPQILANLAVRCFIHLLPGGKESSSFLKANKNEKWTFYWLQSYLDWVRFDLQSKKIATWSDLREGFK